MLLLTCQHWFWKSNFSKITVRSLAGLKAGNLNYSFKLFAKASFADYSALLSEFFLSACGLKKC
jgi:hypothetical protein